MLKWLFWLIILLVFWGISRSRSRAVSHQPKQPKAVGGSNMVACAYCLLHVPEDEAVSRDGRSFCCEQHHRQWTQSA